MYILLKVLQYYITLEKHNTWKRLCFWCPLIASMKKLEQTCNQSKKTYQFTNSHSLSESCTMLSISTSISCVILLNSQVWPWLQELGVICGLHIVQNLTCIVTWINKSQFSLNVFLPHRAFWSINHSKLHDNWNSISYWKKIVYLPSFGLWICLPSCAIQASNSRFLALRHVKPFPKDLYTCPYST